MTEKIKVKDLKIGHTVILNGKETTLSKSNLHEVDSFFNTRNINGVYIRADKEIEVCLFQHYINGKFNSWVRYR